MKIKERFASIRSKMSLIAIGLTLFYLVLGGFSVYFFFLIRQYAGAPRPLEQYIQNTLQIRQYQKVLFVDDMSRPDFIETGSSMSVNEIKRLHNENLQLLDSIRQTGFYKQLETQGIFESVKKMEEAQLQYMELLTATINISRELGVDESGLIGEFHLQETLLRDELLNKWIPDKNEIITILQNIHSEIDGGRKVGEINRHTRELIDLLNLPDPEVSDTLPADTLMLSEISPDSMSVSGDTLLHEDLPETVFTPYLRALENVTAKLSVVMLNAGTLEAHLADAEKHCQSIVKVLQDFTNRNTRRATSSQILLVVIFVFITLGIITFLAGSITRALNKIKAYLAELTTGKFPEKLKLRRGDEIFEMLRSINTIIDSLRKKSDFAREIGQGNLNVDFQPLSNEDTLGVSLIEMRESLKRAELEEQKRKEEDTRRNWATEGLAKFGNILRQNTDVEKLGDEIIRNLVHYLNANQGGLFVVTEEEGGATWLELLASYAYNRKKYLEKKVEVGEGLVGTCAIERKSIYLADVPENYVQITSGLGKANPTNILLTPLIFNDTLYGVVELASFAVFEDYQRHFVETVGESIASTLSTAKINAKTAKLLEQSKIQAEELAAQEEEMRQNMEELQATQEEAERREAELTSLMNSIDSSLFAMEFSIDGDITKVGKVVEQLTGLSADELIGTNHRDYSIIDSPEEYESFWSELRNGIPQHLTTKKRFGSKIIWLRENYSPIYNADGTLVKIYNLAFDVTEAKRAEEQLRKDSLHFESLHAELAGANTNLLTFSKLINSTLITGEINQEGIIARVNYRFAELLSLPAEEITGQPFRKFVDQEDQEKYGRIVEQLHYGKAGETLLRLHSSEGETKWLLIAHARDVNDNGDIENIYFWALDVTRMKESGKI